MKLTTDRAMNDTMAFWVQERGLGNVLRALARTCMERAVGSPPTIDSRGLAGWASLGATLIHLGDRADWRDIDERETASAANLSEGAQVG